MRTLTIVVFLVLASVALAGPKQVRYMGHHPIAKSVGGGFCDIEGPHVHVYAADKVQYREHDGYHVFVGDPVAYGYKGPRYTYKGHHPIHVDLVVGGEPDTEYCYLDGAHFHAFAPPEGELKQVGEVYFYTAKPPRAYYDARPAMIEINAIYTPIVYARPTVTVVAPVGWIGAHVEVVAPRPHAHAHVGVGVGIGVQVVVPSVHVQIGGPAVIIDHHHHHKHKHKHHRHKRNKRHW